MLSRLTNRFSHIFNELKHKAVLREQDITLSLREIRKTLLDADVALPIVKNFLLHIKNRTLGQEVTQSITPAQQIIKIVHDELITLLGKTSSPINLNAPIPVTITLFGLQGCGKTTTCAKLALLLKEKERKKVLLVSVDTSRPAAQQQLQILAQQINVTTLLTQKNESPQQITQRALHTAKVEGYDILLCDTAGRSTLDKHLLNEAQLIQNILSPTENFLVIDAMTGQDAINTAKTFSDILNITSIIATRVDGDTRGGSILSVHSITGKPIKFIGVGEKIHDLEHFHPERFAGRILGMGDIVSLVEKAENTNQIQQNQQLSQKNTFNLNDFAIQLKQIHNMGGLSHIVNLIPGMNKFQPYTQNSQINENLLRQQEAIILSMTKQERQNTKILNASRRKRIAQGSGTTVQQVNLLLKQYQEFTKLTKQFKNISPKKLQQKGLGKWLR